MVGERRGQGSANGGRVCPAMLPIHNAHIMGGLSVYARMCVYVCMCVCGCRCVCVCGQVSVHTYMYVGMLCMLYVNVCM